MNIVATTTSMRQGGGAGTVRAAVVGLGAIGKTLVEKLAVGAVPGVELVAVVARDPEKARRRLADAGLSVPLIAMAELPQVADLAIECAPGSVLPEIARPMLEAGKKVMVISVGALLNHPELVELAKLRGGQIIVPTGALLGLDAVTAAAEGEILSVRMKTVKPVKGLVGAPYLIEHGIDIVSIVAPMKVFEGSAREAAKGFPANLNVAAALSLAGIGPDRTMVEIWADPNLDRNTHHIFVDADSASFELTIRNVPSENPKTGRITPLSIIAALRKLTAPLRIGT